MLKVWGELQSRQREEPEGRLSQRKYGIWGLVVERGGGRQQGMSPEFSAGTALATDRGLTSRTSQSFQVQGLEGLLSSVVYCAWWP